MLAVIIVPHIKGAYLIAVLAILLSAPVRCATPTSKRLPPMTILAVLIQRFLSPSAERNPSSVVIPLAACPRGLLLLSAATSPSTPGEGLAFWIAGIAALAAACVVKGPWILYQLIFSTEMVFGLVAPLFFLAAAANSLSSCASPEESHS